LRQTEDSANKLEFETKRAEQVCSREPYDTKTVMLLKTKLVIETERVKIIARLGCRCFEFHAEVEAEATTTQQQRVYVSL
jgi:hypothetical protein